jgi:hypothetical protein
MLPQHLNTNEVKNAAGTEVEFLRSNVSGSSVTFAQKDEAPNAQHRIKFSHQESGTGVNLMRRSLAEVALTTLGVSETPRRTRAYVVLEAPIGDQADTDDSETVLAELGSLLFTAGTNTFLYDGTGPGADALIKGTV